MKEVIRIWDDGDGVHGEMNIPANPAVYFATLETLEDMKKKLVLSFEQFLTFLLKEGKLVDKDIEKLPEPLKKIIDNIKDSGIKCHVVAMTDIAKAKDYLTDKTKLPNLILDDETKSLSDKLDAMTPEEKIQLVKDVKGLLDGK